jgi:hypothetical protein
MRLIFWLNQSVTNIKHLFPSQILDFVYQCLTAVHLSNIVTSPYTDTIDEDIGYRPP